MFSISLKAYFLGNRIVYTPVYCFTFSIFLLSQAEMAKVGRPRSRFRSPQPFSLLPIQAGWSFRTIFVIFFIIIILITLFSELGSWGISIQTIRMTMKLKLLLSDTNEKRNESVIWGLGPFLLDVSQTLKN